jgi:hypothetical protein
VSLSLARSLSLRLCVRVRLRVCVCVFVCVCVCVRVGRLNLPRPKTKKPEDAGEMDMDKKVLHCAWHPTGPPPPFSLSLSRPLFLLPSLPLSPSLSLPASLRPSLSCSFAHSLTPSPPLPLSHCACRQILTHSRHHTYDTHTQICTIASAYTYFTEPCVAVGACNTVYVYHNDESKL